MTEIKESLKEYIKKTREGLDRLEKLVEPEEVNRCLTCKHVEEFKNAKGKIMICRVDTTEGIFCGTEILEVSEADAIECKCYERSSDD